MLRIIDIMYSVAGNRARGEGIQVSDTLQSIIANCSHSFFSFGKSDSHRGKADATRVEKSSTSTVVQQ